MGRKAESPSWFGMMVSQAEPLPESEAGLKYPRVPDRFVGGLGDLPELFRASAKWRGMTLQQADEIVQLVPPPILRSVCFLDRLTSLWRYDCGEPFVNLHDDQVVFGTNMYTEVDRLFDVIDCARSRLSEDQLKNYLDRLADPNQHQNLLFEFAPILRLDHSIDVDYEIRDNPSGNTTIDWLIRSKPAPLFLEVKYRTRDLLESLARVQRGERDPDGTAPAPTHDHSLLFRSVEQKFRVRRPSEAIQGVWIVTALAQEESELRAAFEKLDASRIHVGIIGDWDDDVYVLANDDTVKRTVLEILRLRESRRAVFNR